MMAWVQANLFGLGILLSFIGWGTLVPGRSLPAWGWAMRAVMGIAVLVALGGWLNLFGLISPVVCLTLLGAGVVLCVLSLVRRRREHWEGAQAHLRALRADPLAAVLLALLVGVLGFLYASYAWDVKFNGQDDFHAYFVFPRKMLQVGSMGDDPFFESRATTGLGGQSFLHALVLAALPNETLRLVEPGVALIIVVGLVIGLSRYRGLGLRAGTLTGLAVLLVDLPQVNISSLVVALASFIVLFHLLFTLGANKRWPASLGVAVGLLVGALCSLKNSLLAPVIFTVLAFLGWRLFSGRGWTRRVLWLAPVGGVSLAVMVPWMLSLYHSSGTLLFPLLGRGYYHLSGFAGMQMDVSLRQAVGPGLRFLARPEGLALMTVTLLLVRLGTHARESALAVLLTFAVLAAAMIDVGAMGGAGTERYAFPFLFGLTVVLGVALLGKEACRASSEVSVAQVSWVTPGVLALLIVVPSLPNKPYYFEKAFSRLRAGAAGARIDDPALVASYEHLLDAVPAGATVLAYLDKPYLLDFRRHTVWCVDWPGGCSLPPGMPLDKGEEALAEYLDACGIAYLAYDYARARLSEAEKSALLARESSPRPRSQWAMGWAFQGLAASLGKIRERVHDDRRVFVLDLARRRQSDNGTREATSLTGNREPRYTQRAPRHQRS